MYLRYHAGRSFRHATTAMLEAALVVAIGAALFFGFAVATGGNPAGAGSALAGGKLTATISMGDGLRAASNVPAGSAMRFAVTRSVPDNDPVMWVTNKCYDAGGQLVSSVDRAVQWGLSTSLEGTAGDFKVAGAKCKAYATLRPWQSSILTNAVITYTVGG